MLYCHGMMLTPSKPGHFYPSWTPACSNEEIPFPETVVGEGIFSFSGFSVNPEVGNEVYYIGDDISFTKITLGDELSFTTNTSDRHILSHGTKITLIAFEKDLKNF